MKLIFDFSGAQKKVYVDVNPIEKLMNVLSSILITNYTALQDLKLKALSIGDKRLNPLATISENDLKDNDTISVSSEGGIFKKYMQNKFKNVEDIDTMKEIEQPGLIYKKQKKNYLENKVTLTVDIRDHDLGTEKFQKANLNKEISLLSTSPFGSYTDLNKSNCDMIIDNVPVAFNKLHKFNRVGKHTIIYKMKTNLLVNSCKKMFFDCDNLISIDLSNFDTTEVTDMSAMFCGCALLSYVNLDFLDTSKVTDMSYMFKECKSLIRVNLNNFRTGKVEIMRMMFYGCNSLKEVDLSHLNTSNVDNLGLIVGECFNLTKLSCNKDTYQKLKDGHDLPDKVKVDIV